MLKPRGRPDLAQKPLAAQCRAEVWVQDLDGDVTTVSQVVGEEHGRHAAGAKLAIDAVAVGERRGKSRENVVVRHDSDRRGER